MALDLDGLDGMFREPSVIVDMTQPAPLPPLPEPDPELELEALPTVVRTVPLANDAWTEVPTLAPEHVQLRSPLRLGLAIACAALALVAAPLAVRRLVRSRPPVSPGVSAPVASPGVSAPVASPGVSAPVAQSALAATATRRPQSAAPVLRQTIPFSLGSTVPQAADEALLAAASRCPGTLVVTGHSCWLGTARVQQAVGLARAEAVRQRLLAGGVDDARIRVHSAGSRQPAASNATSAGRRENRRVTLTCTRFGGEP